MSKIMVISEKPTAARKLALALDDAQSPQEIKKRGASYYECQRGSDELIVVYALGHLYELKQVEKGWTYPRLEMEWVPKYEVDKKAANIKPIISLIKKLAKEVDSFVIATDYDIEGSLIGYLTLKYACGANPEDARRMKFSTLTKTELQMAYENAMSGVDSSMVEAGWVRHEVDWLYGINLTRALTLAIKNTSGWFKIVSTGRVQGPVLSMVVERDRAINVFVPIPYWTLTIEGVYDDMKIPLEYHPQRINIKSEAKAIAEELQDSDGLVEDISRREVVQTPPVPFNLGGLQAEAYRHFGFKPSRTLNLAQTLYIEGLISYPRTNSQRIPPSIDVKHILTQLQLQKSYANDAKEILQRGMFTPVQGKATDPAHPAIHPTGEKPTRRLTPSESKIYDLIVRRFITLFGSSARKERIRITVACAGHNLYGRGQRILDTGWMKYYQKYVSMKEQILPNLEEGDRIRISDVMIGEKRSSPPRRYNPASLLKLLEKEGLGTKATRAQIVDSVRSRGYTLNDKFEVSTLGYALFETLSRYVPSLLSPQFTRELEKDMNRVLNGEIHRNDILKSVRDDLRDLLGVFKEREDQIGQELVQGLQRFWRESVEVGLCPKCNDGEMLIIRSAKTGKRFLGCSNYRDGKCDQTFPLPQKGRIIALDKKCPHCGHQMIRVGSGNRAFETCINWTECPGRQDALKSLQERRTKGGGKND